MRGRYALLPPLLSFCVPDQVQCNIYLHIHVYVYIFVGHHLATKVLIGKLPATRGVWVIINHQFNFKAFIESKEKYYEYVSNSDFEENDTQLSWHNP